MEIPEGWEEFEPKQGDRVWLWFENSVETVDKRGPYEYIATWNNSVVVAEPGFGLNNYPDNITVRPVETATVTLRRDDVQLWLRCHGDIESRARMADAMRRALS